MVEIKTKVCEILIQGKPAIFREIGSDKPSLFIEDDKDYELRLSEEITELVQGDFDEMPSSIKKVVLPQSLKKIDNCAFEETAFSKVIFNNGLLEIGDHAFAYANIQRVEIPKTLRVIRESAFRRCCSLNEVIIHGCQSIKAEAFYGCTNLRNVQLPKKLTHVAKSAFEDCGDFKLTTENE